MSQPYDIDAETGQVKPRPMPETGPNGFRAVQLNPQLANTVAIFAVGFFAGILWMEWQKISTRKIFK